MVYGRYNELVFMGVVMDYKPTNITGAHHPVVMFVGFEPPLPPGKRTYLWKTTIFIGQSTINGHFR